MRPPRVLALLLASVLLVGALFLFIFPGRTYLAQRRTLAAAETRVKVLGSANAQLAQRIQQLQTNAEVERLAREDYGLVMPGQTPYVVLPPQQSPAPPSSAPAKSPPPEPSGPAVAGPSVLAVSLSPAPVRHTGANRA